MSGIIDNHIEIKDWKLCEHQFEQDEDAIYQFTVVNSSNQYNLEDVTLTMILDPAMTNVSVAEPKGCIFTIPQLFIGQEVVKTLSLVSHDATPGTYPVKNVTASYLVKGPSQEKVVLPCDMYIKIVHD